MLLPFMGLFSALTSIIKPLLSSNSSRFVSSNSSPFCTFSYTKLQHHPQKLPSTILCDTYLQLAKFQLQYHKQTPTGLKPTTRSTKYPPRTPACAQHFWSSSFPLYVFHVPGPAPSPITSFSLAMHQPLSLPKSQLLERLQH